MAGWSLDENLGMYAFFKVAILEEVGDRDPRTGGGTMNLLFC